MLRVPYMKSEPKRQVKFTGICADAKALEVSREHLYRVLTGQRSSQSLLKRYQHLKQTGEVLPAPKRKRAPNKPPGEDHPAQANPTPGLQAPASENQSTKKGKL